jgi:hypothetical protein
MKQWIGIVAALLIETQAHAQPDGNSARVYYPSCLAAADIVQGKGFICVCCKTRLIGKLGSDGPLVTTMISVCGTL